VGRGAGLNCGGEVKKENLVTGGDRTRIKFRISPVSGAGITQWIALGCGLDDRGFESR
jgi:hypothetical protein